MFKDGLLGRHREESEDKRRKKECGSLSLLVLSPFSQSFSKTGQ